MDTQKTKSIRTKLVLIIMSASIVAIVAGLATYLVFDMIGVRNEIKKNAILNATLVGQYSVVPLLFDYRDEARDVLSKLSAIPSVENACIFSSDGGIFASYQQTQSNSYLFPKPERSSAKFKDGYLNVFHEITFEGKIYGILFLNISASVIHKKLLNNILIMFSLILIILIPVYIIASRLQKMISVPILNLAELAEKISSNHDFNIRLEHLRNDEVGILYKQFNNLLLKLKIRETERDKAEEEIKKLNVNLEKKVAERTALLEEANKEMEAFSYSVSHDLRAPLRHINGYVDLLFKRNGDKLNEKGQHYLNSISEASTQMGNLIDNLLQFSRTGRMEMKSAKVDMNKQVNDAITLLNQDIEGRKITWKIESLPNVYADYTLIRQVWVNLIGNAIKYTSQCEEANIRIGTIEKDNEYIFYISDNGAGFNMEYSHKLFGVFQRLHSNEEYEGIGIGLANVKQIIKKHNGRTWAEGEINKGATFYFSLPKIQEILTC